MAASLRRISGPSSEVFGVFGAGLNGPMPFLNMSFTSADLRQWEPEQLRIIAMLGRLNERNPHPLVSLAELRAVRNQALYGHIDVVKERAAALVRSIGQSFDFRLTRILLPEMSRWDFFEEDAGKNPVAERQERYGAFARSVAAETWERFPDPVTVVMELDRRMREIQPLEPKCDATDIAWWLLEAKPEAVRPFVQQLLCLPESPVAHCLVTGLVHLHRKDSATAVEVASQALDTGASAFRHAVAHHFTWNLRVDIPLHEGEVALISRLLADPDTGVRLTAVGALRRLAAFRPREALDLARAVNVRSDPRIMTELCHLADPHWEGCRNAFADEDVNAFLERIEEVDDLNYDAALFLQFACERIPHVVVEMLLRRIERQDRDGYRSGYKPVPFRALHDTFSGLAGTDRHRELLCRVRDYSLDKKGLTLKSLADLYRDVSQQYGPVGVDVLADWLVKGNQGQMETAAALLEETSTQFVFDQLELVVRALDRAEAFGNECLRKVAGVFYKIAMSGIRSGTPGQPFPQDIALREQCQKLLPQLPADRAAYRLFRDVLREAERDIQAAAQDEEE